MKITKKGAFVPRDCCFIVVLTSNPTGLSGILDIQLGATRGEDKDGEVVTMETYPDEDDGTGHWVKFMSQRGCFAYCHSITCEVAFSRPDDYDSSDEAKGGGEDTCRLSDLPVRCCRPIHCSPMRSC